MDTGKIYYDVDGNERTIHQMVRVEPDWAASIIQWHEAENERLKKELAELREKVAVMEGE